MKRSFVTENLEEDSIFQHAEERPNTSLLAILNPI